MRRRWMTAVLIHSSLKFCNTKINPNEINIKNINKIKLNQNNARKFELLINPSDRFVLRGLLSYRNGHRTDSGEQGWTVWSVSDVHAPSGPPSVVNKFTVDEEGRGTTSVQKPLLRDWLSTGGWRGEVEDVKLSIIDGEKTHRAWLASSVYQVLVTSSKSTTIRRWRDVRGWLHGC